MQRVPSPIVWHNGTFCAEQEVQISMTDHGFMYGMGAFETLRTVGGIAQALARHAQRLRDTCEELHIAYAFRLADIEAIIAQLLVYNRLSEGHIRWVVAAGTPEQTFFQGKGYTHPTVLLSAKPLPPVVRPKALHRLRKRRSAVENEVRRKTFHYMNNVLARQELHERNVPLSAEGLFCDGYGHVVEGIVTNVFWTDGHALYTPSLETGCLPGIMRQQVIAYSHQCDIPCIQGVFSWEQMVASREIFVTNALQGIVEVHALYDEGDACVRRWDEVPGTITRKMQQLE
jgi:4-amino-4-deoxychorismate lyase